MDSKGLVALWRETLLAQKVLQNQTKGYKKHPQLFRFKKQTIPLAYICNYLHSVCDEADRRDYKFDRSKVIVPLKKSLPQIYVTKGQVTYEWSHFLQKLALRAPDLFSQLQNITEIKLHPLFRIIEGDIEDWEIISKK